MTNFPVYAMAGGIAGLLIATSIYVYLRRQPQGTAADAGPRRADPGRRHGLPAARVHRAAPVPRSSSPPCWRWAIGPWTAGAYLFGGVCSVVAGLVGMKAATKANVRTTEAARASRPGARRSASRSTAAPSWASRSRRSA